MFTRRRSLRVLSAIVTLSMIFSGFSLLTVSAQDEQLTSTPEPTEPPLITETPEPTPTPTGETSQPDQEVFTFGSTEDEVTASATTLYVALTGSNSSACTLSSPCNTIQRAVNRSGSGDTINVAEGTYYRPDINAIPNVVIFEAKQLTLSGGWQNDFTEQTGVSIIDGQNANNGILATNGSTVIVDRFIVQNSRSQDSGALYISGGSFTLTNSTVRNNIANNRGAGIFLISNPVFSLINSTISGNTAAWSGGGVYVHSGTLSIEYSTIAYNTSNSGNGGGVFLGAGALNVHNSILANNISSTSPNCNSLSASDYNIIGPTAGCSFTAGEHDQFDIDPGIDEVLLGAMPIHELLGGSPAIDAGDPVSCAANTGNLDQRGVTRPQDAGCDIGAFEYVSEPGTPFRLEPSSGNNQRKPVGEAFDDPLTVLVLDFYGTPVVGINVTFTAPATGASGTFAGSGSNIEMVTTNGSGVATSSVFTGNSIIGVYNVVVSTNEPVMPISFSLENGVPRGTPAGISLTGGNNQEQIFNQAYPDPLSVTVLDPYGDPISSEIEVMFIAPIIGASGTFASTGKRYEKVNTSAVGIATSSTFTVNSILGDFNVVVFVQGITDTASFLLSNTYVPGLPTHLIYISGKNQQTPINQAFRKPFVVRVVDAVGDPVSGVSVTFSAPVTNPSGTFASNGMRTETVLTDSNGYATSSVFRANRIAGSYVVRASASGLAAQITFFVHNWNIRQRQPKPRTVR